jgi:hypothetical protein
VGKQAGSGCVHRKNKETQKGRAQVISESSIGHESPRQSDFEMRVSSQKLTLAGWMALGLCQVSTSVIFRMRLHFLRILGGVIAAVTEGYRSGTEIKFL